MTGNQVKPLGIGHPTLKTLGYSQQSLRDRGNPLSFRGRKTLSTELLAQTHPRIKIVLFTNMALGIADRLRKATRAMSVFD